MTIVFETKNCFFMTSNVLIFNVNANLECHMYKGDS